MLAGKVCLVTGATRGIGKGVALQLAGKGAKVYITGRTLDSSKGGVGGSLNDTVREIEARGGVCVPIQCDHSKQDEIERVFRQIERENDGQLDIVVNNAFSAGGVLVKNQGKTFWEQSPTIWDDVNAVGLRNNYFCSVYAARLMVPRKSGLIVNISSFLGLKSMPGTACAFGICKEACDRMAADCGVELQKHNVAYVSLWPGVVSTESVLNIVNEQKAAKNEGPNDMNAKFAQIVETCESPEFPGQCIVGLACDPDLMKMSGKILMTSDLGRKYKLQDTDGRSPMDICSIKGALKLAGFNWLAWLMPSFVRVPKWLMHLGGNKFY